MDGFEGDVAAVGRIDVVPKILEVVCRTTGMGFAAVARVTEERWIACAVRDEIAFGLQPGGELEIKTTICDEIRASGEPVLIDHVAEDPLFRDHHTPAQYGFQSYVSVPIVLNGEFFGTLCAIDPNPAPVKTPQVRGMFELFAELIAQHLETNRQLEASAAALIDASEASVLREQFIAVLGHDLRNPLASIDGGLRLMRKTPLNERALALAGMMEQSVRRMAGLIDNILDFARGRLGGGIEVGHEVDERLGAALEQVIAELRTSRAEGSIEADIRLTHAVRCDARRIAQLFSNLLANALTHGREDVPVRVRASTDGGVFELSVANDGDPIPPDTQLRLFQPFSRASASPHQQGLGLGLYISSEIARAHGGTLEVASDETETRFTLRMPVG